VLDVHPSSEADIASQYHAQASSIHQKLRMFLKGSIHAALALRAHGEIVLRPPLLHRVLIAGAVQIGSVLS
jgi:hypothetical protein